MKLLPKYEETFQISRQMFNMHSLG